MTDRCELCATVLSARRLRVKVSRGPKADLARRQVGPRLRSTPETNTARARTAGFREQWGEWMELPPRQ